jgi:hypothetical protein
MKHAAAYSLIGILLLSVSGLKLSYHSCGGELRSLAIYEKAEACEHAKIAKQKESEDGACCGESASHCKRKKQREELEKEKCCDDQEISFEILDLETVELLASDWTSIDFCNTGPTPPSPIYKTFLIQNRPLEPRFKPPAEPPNILVLHQVFLI